MIKLLPTARLVVLLTGGVVPALLYVVEQSFFSVWLVYNAVVIAAALADYLLLKKAQTPEVKREFPARVLTGSECEVKVSATNRAARAVRCEIADEPPVELLGRLPPDTFAAVVLAPDESGGYAYRLDTSVRGIFKFGAINLRLAGPLGLLWRRTALKVEDEIKILPDINLSGEEALEIHLRRYQSQEQRQAHFVRYEGREFDSLREFHPDDDPRHVDWRASARAAKLITRVYRSEVNHEVLLCLDAGRLMGTSVEGRPKFDYALTAALRLAAASLALGDRPSMIVFADEIRAHIPAGKGPAHLPAMIDAVCDVHPVLRDPDFMGLMSRLDRVQRRRSLVVMLTDFSDAYSSDLMKVSLNTLARRHKVLFVAMGNPETRETAYQYPRDTEIVARSLVAAQMMRERREVLVALSRAGMEVIDASPHEVGGRMINKYFEMKRVGRA